MDIYIQAKSYALNMYEGSFFVLYFSITCKIKKIVCNNIVLKYKMSFKEY